MCEIALQLGHHCSVCSEFSGEVNVQISSDIPNVYLKAKKKIMKNDSRFSFKNGEVTHFSFQFVKSSPPSSFILK